MWGCRPIGFSRHLRNLPPSADRNPFPRPMPPKASASVSDIATPEEDGPELNEALTEVHSTLCDTEAPNDAKKDAALRCWALSEHRVRRVEKRRQELVAGFGEFPYISGRLVDLAVSSQVEEVQWRVLRSLIQLAFDNPKVAWMLAQNGVKEGRALAKDEEKRLGQLREEAKKDVAGVDQDIKKESQKSKERIAQLRSRTTTPKALMSLLDEGRKHSHRVKECIFHVFNNLANSCWELHDIILKDKVLAKAHAMLADKSEPDYVVSAIVGFLCSLSYKPKSRQPMVEAGVLDALRSVIVADSTDLNSMSAVLCVANVSGHMKQELCPAITPELQIAAKVIAALQAVLNRQTFGGRYGTIWKVCMAVSALCQNPEHHKIIVSSNGPAVLCKVLEAKSMTMHPLAEEHASMALLTLSLNDGARDAVLGSAPRLKEVLEATCRGAGTALGVALAEAALWGLGELHTPLTATESNGDATAEGPAAAGAEAAGGGAEEEGAGARKQGHVMVSYHALQARHAECIVAALQSRGYSVRCSGPAGLSNIESGVRGSAVLLPLLSDAFQLAPLCRAEVLAAVALAVPVRWLLCPGAVQPPPHDWVEALPDHARPGAGGRSLSMKGMQFDPASNTLVPREELSSLVEEIAAVLDETEAAAVGSSSQKAALKLPPVEHLTLAEVLDWSVEDVSEWFEQALQLPQYRDLLFMNGVDGLLLVELDDDDLETELRIEDERHREVILAWIVALKRKSEPA